MFGGRNNYPYICARVKAKKSFLLGKDAFQRLLAMDLAGVGRYLGETQYREEITALGSDYTGASLIELAISQNLAKTYTEVLSYTGGHAKEIITEYLHRWDIYNMKTIIRGKVTKASTDEIREILIPAGSLKPELVSQLIQAVTWEEFLDKAKQQKVVYIEEDLLRNAISSGKLATLEDSLDKEYYYSLLKSIKETTISEKRFMDFMRREIDIVNLKTLCKLKSEESSGETISQYFIHGGVEFGMDRLNKMASSEGLKDIFDEVRQSSYADYLPTELETCEKCADISSLMRLLDRVLLMTADKFSHLYPLSVLPVLDFVLRKKIEVDNIRIIARGKESGLNPDLIKKLLVL